MAKSVYVGVESSMYTQLEYIESSGTQYIDMGIKANQNTRVVVDHHLYSSGGDASIFGAWNGFASNGFIYVVLSSMTSGYWCYANGTSGINMTATGRHTVDANGNVLTLDGTTLATATATTFSGSHNMYLFAHNEAGLASNLATARIYSCKVYDSGTLVRDFVPAVGANGAGMYDRVNGTFYPNAGSGSFSTGPATGTTLGEPGDGIARQVKKMYVGVGNTARKVKKGYIGVNGVARLFYSSGLSIIYTGTHTTSDLTVDGVDHVLYTLTGSGTLTVSDSVEYYIVDGGKNGGAGTKVQNNGAIMGGKGGDGGRTQGGTLPGGEYVVTIAAAAGLTTIGQYGTPSADYGGSGGGAAGSYSSKSPGTGQGTTTRPFGLSSFDAHSAGGGGGAGYRYENSKLYAYNGGTGGSNGADGGSKALSGTTSSASARAGGTKGGGKGATSSAAGASATFYGSGGGGGSGTAVTSGTATSTKANGKGYQGVAYILIPKEMLA